MAEITNAIINFFQELFGGNNYLTIIFIGLFPIIELRGSIPVAFKLGLPWYEALFFCWLGSSLVAPILILLLRPILNWMKKTKLFKSLAHAVESTFEGKASKIKDKAANAESERKALIKKMVGVFLFVAVPLPLTGVWTGSAVAVFLGLKFWQALPMVLLGNLTAGIIMTVLSVCFKEYVDLILGIFMIIVLVVVVFYIVMLTIKIVKQKKASKTNEVNMIETCDEVVNADCNDDNVESAINNSENENIDMLDSKESIVQVDEKSIDKDSDKQE